MSKHEFTLGYAPTRRNVFSKEDAQVYKRAIEAKIRSWGVRVVNLDWLNDEGLLIEREEVDKVARRFREEKVDAIFIPHCNFGTEYAVSLLAQAVGKPVLLWGPRDEAPLPDGTRQRDTQCGLFATGKVLRRLNVPYTYITNSRVDSPEFERGFKDFVAAASAANAFLGARIGQIDTRVAPFWTVICNEGELLERWGIQVAPISLVDVERGVKKMVADQPQSLKDTIADIKSRIDVGNTPEELLQRMGALKLFIADWAEREQLSGVAFQCWDAMQVALGFYPCFIDGELTGMGLPVACETDIHGALTAVMVQAAARYTKPIFFADLTIRHPTNNNAELLWHCGPFPSKLAKPGAPRRIVGNYIAPNRLPALGDFPLQSGDLTLARMDGDHGQYSLLVGHAKTTDGPVTRGTYVWAEVGNWPKWEHKLVTGPYIHHIVGIYDRLAPVLVEACKYIPGLTPDPVEPTAEEIAAHWRGEGA